MDNQGVITEPLKQAAVEQLMSIVDTRAITLRTRHVNDPSMHSLFRIRRWKPSIVRLEELGRVRGMVHYAGSDGYIYCHHYSAGYSSGIGGAHTPGESRFVRLFPEDLMTYTLDDLVSLLDSLT